MAKVQAYQVYRVVFVVVGVLIAAALVIWVIFALQHRGEQVRRDQSSQIADRELKQQQSSSSSTNTGTVSTPSDTSPQSNNSSVATTTQPTATELPVTGISDTLAPLFVISLLSFTTASYVMSRRRLKRFDLSA
jgi:cytoskeletal protein RodZ